MKYRTAPHPRKVFRKKKHGFALIATLTLLMLLTLVAVGILAIASSQTRIASVTVLQAEARQQALVGLDAAIGTLQAEVGPDCRVTAHSGILNANDNEKSGGQYLLGVWNSWDAPLYGKSKKKGFNIQATYDKGRSKMFRRWLISCRNRDAVTQLQSGRSLSTPRLGSRVCLLGAGTLGGKSSSRDFVYADLLDMPSKGTNKGSFAWWVCGENQKAKLSIATREKTSDPLEILHRTWDTPGPMVVGSEKFTAMPDEIPEPDKLVTLSTLPLMVSTSQADGLPYFFDLTTTAYSLPTNVSTGGIKRDLCLLLNRPSLRNTDFAGRSNQDCPIAENDAIPRGSEPNMPIGSWQVLHDYYNAWPNGTANDSNNFTARLLGDVDNAYTRMSGTAYKMGGSSSAPADPNTLSVGTGGMSFYDSRSLMDNGSTYAGYARTPVLLAFMNNFGLVTLPKEGVFTSDGDQVYRLDMCFASMALWWNPYNVPMRIRGKQLWSHSLPYKTSWIQTFSVNQAGTWNYTWSRYAMMQGTGNAQLGQDFGEFFQKSLGAERDDIVMQPGEILFFSPGKARTNKGAAFSNPWVEGYNPSSVAGFRALFYSSGGPNQRKDSPGIASKSNIDNGYFYVQLRLGINGGDGQHANPNNGGPNATDGYWFAPRSAEVFTVMNGYGGMDGQSSSGDTAAGKRCHSPQRMLLGWYNPNEGKNYIFANQEDATWATDGTQSDENVPYYVGSMGVVVKSANNTLGSDVDDGDYRSKIWQHSCPAFWGSAIRQPDAQEKAYHPYQLAIIPVSAGLCASPMDNIGRNGILGITSEGDGEEVSFASVLELPVHPPFSLAGLSGMRLQPGWYTSGAGKGIGALRRMQYQSGVPGVGIGNAFADPCLPATDIYTSHSYKMTAASASGDQGGNDKVFNDFYDHGLLINDALWDAWFCSSISDMPSKRGNLKAEDVLRKFITGKEDLPVARYKKTNTPFKDEEIISRLMADDGWKYPALYLMIDGGFNVNSTSVDAWAATLQGLANRKLVTNVNGKLSEVEPGRGETDVVFSRFAVSTTDKACPDGGYSMKRGDSFRKGSGLAAWSEVRLLSQDSIRKLAERIVEKVRERGPFLSMSDFINRRLEEGENSLTGALQAAIDATDINRDFKDVTVKVPNGSLYKNRKAAEGPLYTAAPGYLIQSDVLASLGNILTVRDDTFTIRAYGCVRTKNNVILSQAWCEAIVQRTIDYVDPTNSPEDSELEPDGSASRKKLSQVNKTLGRRFRVVSFKWVDAWDI